MLPLLSQIVVLRGIAHDNIHLVIKITGWFALNIHLGRKKIPFGVGRKRWRKDVAGQAYGNQVCLPYHTIEGLEETLSRSENFTKHTITAIVTDTCSVQIPHYNEDLRSKN